MVPNKIYSLIVHLLQGETGQAGHDGPKVMHSADYPATLLDRGGGKVAGRGRGWSRGRGRDCDRGGGLMHGCAKVLRFAGRGEKLAHRTPNAWTTPHVVGWGTVWSGRGWGTGWCGGGGGIQGGRIIADSRVGHIGKGCCGERGGRPHAGSCVHEEQAHGQ